MITSSFADLYRQIRENALSGACTVAILVAPDVDALCACRTLCHMLRSDCVTYSLIPVSGYGQVAALFQRWAETSHDIRSVFLINCGAIANLANMMPWEGSGLTCYVIDSHRPVHLSNIYEHEKVWVLRNEEEELEEDLPSDGDGLSGDEETSDEEEEEEEEQEEELGEEELSDREDDEAEERSEVGSEEEMDLGDGADEEGEDEEADGESDGEVPKRRRKRRVAADDEEEEEGEEGDDERSLGAEEEKDEEGAQEEGERMEEEGGDEPPKGDEDGAAAGGGEEEGEQAEEEDDDDDDDDSMMSEGEKQRRREKRRKKKRRDQAAKEGGQQEKPSTLRRRRIRQYYNGSYFGSPSAFVMHRISQELAKESRESLWMAIVGLTDMLFQQHLDHDQYVSMATSLEVEVNLSNARRPDFQAADGTVIPASEAGRVEAEMELKFMLYRHWSLYESMYHSNYVASRLQVWRSYGKLRMEELFAKMGFSLAQCKEKYKYMDPGLRQRLRAELERHQPDYSLDDVFFLSFVRYYGYRSPVSASDLVYSIGALLDVGPGTKDGSGSLAPQLHTAAGGGENEDEELVSRFHDALEALSLAKEDKIMEGVGLAMGLQRALFRLAVSLLDKREIKGVKHFRYAVIHNNVGSTEDRLFTHPLALTKLAIFLVDVDRELGKAPSRARTWKARPLVLLAERANTYLVVGVTCPDRLGEVKRNRFGQAFRYAAEQIQARYRHDGFDSAVMEIDKADMQRFVESLHLTMDA